jgi:predicted RND superfamily exporter protein
VTAWPIRAPLRAVVVALVLLAAAGVALARMRLDPEVEGMLGGPAARTYGEVAERFGWRERAFVLIEAERPGQGERLLAAGAALRDALLSPDASSDREAGSENPCAAVEFGAPLSDTETSAVDLLFPYGFVLLQDPAALERLLTPAALVARFEQQLGRLSLPGLGEQDRAFLEDPLGLRPLLAARLVGMRGGYRFAADSTAFLDADKRALLVVVRGHADPDADSTRSALAAQRLAGAIRRGIDAARLRLGPAAEDLRFGTTGACVFADESARQVRDDLILSLSVSFVLAAFLLAIGLHLRIDRVLLLIVPTLWGSAVGIGAFVALRAEVSALSFGCAAILIGLGIDFTIHVTTAALQHRSRGARVAAALFRAFRETRGRLALAACTSAAAFLAFLSSDAGFLRDMGIMTTAGLVTCLAAPFLLLPVILGPMLARLPRGGGVATGAPSFRLMGRLAEIATSRPRTVVVAWAALVLAAVAWVAIEPPRREDDLRNLHARDSQALATQRRMGELFGGSFEPILVLVRGGEDPLDLVDRCARIESALAPMTTARAGANAPLVAALSIADLLPAREVQERILATLAAADPAELERSVRAALDEVFVPDELPRAYLDGLGRALRLERPVLPDDLRRGPLAPLVERFLPPAANDRPTDHALVVLQPSAELWDGDARAAVLGRVHRAIDDLPGVVGLTGLLPTAVESAELVVGNFTRVAGLTLLAVLLVLVVRYRDPGRILLVLAPSAVGVALVAALFSLLDVRLNLMNVGVLPMVLALGIDDGIHVVEHAGPRGRRRPLGDVLESTGTGVLLTSFTTMVTFGSLAWSRSRGLASVGLLSFLGIGLCLLASLILLPALLAWSDRRRLAAPAGRVDHPSE